MDVEAQVTCIAEKHGVGEGRAATQLAWKVRVQAIRMNEVGETAWCNLLHTHGHSCAAGTFQNDDALRPDGRDAQDGPGCSNIEGVERPPREVDVVPHPEAVNPRAWCRQAASGESGSVPALRQHYVVEGESHRSVQDVGALIEGQHRLLRVIEVDGCVRQVPHVLGEVRVLAVEQEVRAESGRGLTCRTVAKFDDRQLSLPLCHSMCKDKLAHALLADLHDALSHAIGAGMLH